MIVRVAVDPEAGRRRRRSTGSSRHADRSRCRPPTCGHSVVGSPRKSASTSSGGSGSPANVTSLAIMSASRSRSVRYMGVGAGPGGSGGAVSTARERPRSAVTASTRTPRRAKGQGAALELLVVAADLRARILADIARGDDRVDHIVDPSAFATRARSIGGSSSERTNARAPVSARVAARARGRPRSAERARRRGRRRGASVPSTSSGSPRAWRRDKLVEQGLELDDHSSSHSLSRLVRWIAW